MTDIGTFAFRDMTIEVSRTVGDVLGQEVLWLRRVNCEIPTCVGIVRNGGLVVANSVDFRTGSTAAAELEMALREFMIEHRGPVHAGGILAAPTRHGRPPAGD